MRAINFVRTGWLDEYTCKENYAINQGYPVRSFSFLTGTHGM